MSSPSASTQPDVSLYIAGEWAGPFTFEQVRFFHRQGQVDDSTYAYDNEAQQHHTVGELLAEARPDTIAISNEASSASRQAFTSALVPPDLDDSSTPSTTRYKRSTDTVRNEEPIEVVLPWADNDPAATLGSSLDALAEPLASFHRRWRDLTEGQPTDRRRALSELESLASSFTTKISIAGPTALNAAVGDLAQLVDYLANRHQDVVLAQRLGELRSRQTEGDTPAVLAAVRTMIEGLVNRARNAGSSPATPGLEPRTDRNPQAGQPADHQAESKPHRGGNGSSRIIGVSSRLAAAHIEVQSSAEDVARVQAAYDALQEQRNEELAALQELLARAESARADEDAAAKQALAEVRALAAEIHRLASEHLASEGDLGTEITQLARELAGQDATAMAPLAEGLLVRLVTRLRNLAASGHGDDSTGDAIHRELVETREELARVRGELAQARNQLLITGDERDRLRRQIDEQKNAAERIVAAARERENRLRSTVASLESSRDLHQQVMSGLESQLAAAQDRVADMEGQLAATRAGLGEQRRTIAGRIEALADDLRRAVELRAMLEARQSELEDQLGRSDVPAPSTPEGRRLRDMLEATKRKLAEQASLSERLESEMAECRQQASALGGRSDDIAHELESARSELSAARRHFDELGRAHQRLEAERESLQGELATRRVPTDALRREDSGIRPGTDRHDSTDHAPGTNRLVKAMEQLENRLAETQRRLETTSDQLDSERRRAAELGSANSEQQARIDDLTADRDHLRAEVERLHHEQFELHSRNAASLARATQATIDAERRLREATARAMDLERRIGELEDVTDQGPLEQLTIDGEDDSKPASSSSSARAIDAIEEECARLRDRLRESEADRERLAGELTRLGHEHEAAAVEHRAAIKSARDRLVEAQERLALHDRNAATAGDSIEVRKERDRLAEQVRSLTLQIDQAAAAEELPEARRRIGNEIERIQALTRSLSDTQAQADAARGRLIEVETQLAAVKNERDRLQLECQQLSLRAQQAEIKTAVHQGGENGRQQELQRKLDAATADREALLEELGRVNAELQQTRTRLLRTGAEVGLGARIAGEQHRLAELERQIAEARNAADGARHERERSEADVRRLQERLSQYDAILGERDDLRRRLERARVRIRTLRSEAQELRRKLAIGSASGQMPAVDEATPNPMTSPFTASGTSSHTFRATRATTASPGFTSMFGRPSIPAPMVPQGIPLNSAIATVRAASPQAAATMTQFPTFDTPATGTLLFPTSGLTTAIVRKAPSHRRIVAMGVGAVVGCLLASAGVVVLAMAAMPIQNGSVQARVEHLTASIPGLVTLRCETGQELLPGAAVADLVNDRVDRSALESATAREQGLRARQSSVAAELETIIHLRQPSDANEAATRSERLAALGRESAALGDSIANAAVARAAEQKAVEAASRATITAQTKARVQRLSTANGQWMKTGDLIADVVDPASILTVCELDHAGDANPGDRVRVRLLRGDVVFNGVIQEITPDPVRTGILRAVIPLPEGIQGMSLIGAPARIAVLGPAPGPLSSLLARIRVMMP